MKRVLAVSVFVVALMVIGFLPPPSAEASENALGSLNDGGTLVRTFIPTFNPPSAPKNVTVQCPDQAVYLRAGCASGCVVDAGPGDVYVSFIGAPDSYPFPLAPVLGQDRIHVQRDDGGVVNCNFFQVLQ